MRFYETLTNYVFALSRMVTVESKSALSFLHTMKSFVADDRSFVCDEALRVFLKALTSRANSRGNKHHPPGNRALCDRQVC